MGLLELFRMDSLMYVIVDNIVLLDEMRRYESRSKCQIEIMEANLEF